MTFPSTAVVTRWLFGSSLLVLSVAVALRPAMAAASVGALFIVAVGLSLRSRLPRVFLWLLGATLVGYAFLGRGFAYIGVAPIYIGEAVLLSGVIVVALSGGLAQILRLPLVWLLIAFMTLGAFSTMPYLATYGVDSLRDAVVWGYGVFALLSAGVLLRADHVASAIASFRRGLPLFLFWTPVAVAIFRFAYDLIPTVPGSEVSLLNAKGGDIAVHLAGVLAFLVLGLHRTRVSSGIAPIWREYVWWLLWIVAWISVLTVRAAILSVASVVVLLMLVRPLSNWGKLLFVVVVVATVVVAVDLELQVGVGRSVSTQDLVVSVQSIFRETGESAYDSSRTWRLRWWSEIVQYTVLGDYFWTGKGYGINLADSDGFQAYADGALRSPHNSHLTILARGGVPSAFVWLALQGVYALQLLRAYLRSKRLGLQWWARVDLWLLAYWLAFMVNAAFDVYLEGPQGGIWFWTVFGLGIAALETQRRHVEAHPQFARVRP